MFFFLKNTQTFSFAHLAGLGPALQQLQRLLGAHAHQHALLLFARHSGQRSRANSMHTRRRAVFRALGQLDLRAQHEHVREELSKKPRRFWSAMQHQTGNQMPSQHAAKTFASAAQRLWNQLPPRHSELLKLVPATTTTTTKRENLNCSSSFSFTIEATTQFLLFPPTRAPFQAEKQRPDTRDNRDDLWEDNTFA